MKQANKINKNTKQVVRVDCSSWMKSSFVKLALLAIILGGMLSGCGQKENVKHLKFQEISEELEETYMDTIMVEMNDADVLALFDLNPSQVVQVYYKFAFLDTRADEVVMIQLSDSSLVAQVEAVLWERVADLRNEFDGYIDDQKRLVDEAIVFHEGNYLFLLVGARALDLQDYIINSFS